MIAAAIPWNFYNDPYMIMPGEPHFKLDTKVLRNIRGFRRARAFSLSADVGLVENCRNGEGRF